MIMQPLSVQASRTRVKSRLQEAILSGDLAPAEPVPIAAAAQRLGVSPTPVREALIELEAEGFLEASPNRGFFVRPLDPEEVRDLYPLIWTLEQLALREALPDAAALDTLGAVNRLLTEPGLSPQEAVDLDTRWHAALLAGSTNTILAGTLDRLKARARRYELAYMRGTGRVERSADEHQRIETALRRGDLAAALRSLEANWEAGPRVLLPWLRTRPAPRRTP